LTHEITGDRGELTFNITDFEVGIDTIDLNSCFDKKRTIVEIGMKRSAYKNIRGLTVSIVGERGQTITSNYYDNLGNVLIVSEDGDTE
jgi:uncharacterized protein RhaS with RHS repeats